MAFTLTINGTDKASILEAGTFVISEVMEGRNTCSFNTLDKTGVYRVQEGWEVIVEEDGERVFAGFISDVEEESKLQSSGTRLLRCKCQCNDYNELVDRHLAVEAWDDTDAGDIVQDLVTNYLAQDGVFGRYYESVLQLDPILYWPLNEGSGSTATDAANSYDGTCNDGAVLTGTVGPLDGYTDETVASFDNSNDDISVADDPALDAGTGAFAVCGWFRRPSSELGTLGVMASKRASTGATQGWWVGFTASDTFGIGRRDGSANTEHVAPSTSGYIDDEWHFFAAGWTGSASFLHLDDNQDLGTPTTTSRDVSNSEAFRAGNTGSAAEAFGGELAHIAFFVGTIPTDEEFMQLYRAGIDNPIQDGFAPSRISTNYRPVGETLNTLATVTSLSWNIDYYKTMRFFDRATNTAPIVLDDDGDTFTDIAVKRAKDQYRNAQYLRGGLNRSDSRVETFVGDGTLQTFITSYPIDATPTITVNAASETVGIKGVDTGKDWYWNRGEDVIVQDDAATPLISTDTLSVTYYGLTPLLAISRLEDEITARAALDNTSGIFEHLHEETDIDEQDMAAERATGLLRRFGQTATTVKFTTSVNQTASASSLKAGQIIPITVTAHDLDDQFLIESITKRYRSEDDTLVIECNCSDNENLGSWVEFFRRLNEKAQQGVDKDSEILMRLRDFTAQVAITDTETAVSAANTNPLVDVAIVGFSQLQS